MGILSTTSILLANAKSKLKFVPENFRSTILHRFAAFVGSTAAPAPALSPNLKHYNNEKLMLMVRYGLNGTCDHCVISTDNNSFRVVTGSLPNLSLLRTENYHPEYLNAADYIVRACSNSKWMLLTCQKLPGPPYELLWDPTTDEMKRLPPSAVWPPPSLPRCSWCWGLGLGFDPRASWDYKVVRSYLFEYEDFYEIRSEVWSLGTGLWKEIPYPLDNVLHPNENGALHINGFYCWLCYHSRTRSHFIILFDFANDMFLPAPIPVPQSVYLGTKAKVVLAEFHGALAAVLYDFDPKRRSGLPAYRNKLPCFEIWVWNNGWYLMDRFDVPARARVGAGFLLTILGLYMNDKALIQDSKGDLLLYDCNTRKLENLGIHDQACNMRVFPYVEKINQSLSFRWFRGIFL